MFYVNCCGTQHRSIHFVIKLKPLLTIYTKNNNNKRTEIPLKMYAVNCALPSRGEAELMQGNHRTEK